MLLIKDNFILEYCSNEEQMSYLMAFHSKDRSFMIKFVLTNTDIQECES